MSNTLIKRVIVQLREEHIKVTIHDTGADNCVFVLAVVADEPSVIWDTALITVDFGLIPRWEGKIMFFPELAVDAETYNFICA